MSLPPAPPASSATARAVCLLSGGMDSAVALAEARRAGFDAYALSVYYGQRHRVELSAAQRVARALGAAEHRVLALDLREFSGSALTGARAVPKDRPEAEIGRGGAPATYVPARNAILLSLALGWAEVLGARELYIGVNVLDSSGYPDCGEPFLRAFEQLAEHATAAGAQQGARFRVRAPLIALDKAGIVRRARELGVDLGLTHTCYDPLEGQGAPAGTVLACGRCDACVLRLKGFREAGWSDPIPYVRATKGERA